tara:strand:- start:185 stop:532 length:348 start_codon:yes stop_codon:yes gene_type:complete
MKQFIEEFTLNERFNESKKILLKHPSRIPVIVEKSQDCDLNEIQKKKYLVSRDLSISEFMFIIRKRIHLDPAQAIFIMINNTLPSSNSKMGEIYENYKNEDGFLYAIYTSENTFG